MTLVTPGADVAADRISIEVTGGTGRVTVGTVGSGAAEAGAAD
jgi:hypothetical protein